MATKHKDHVIESAVAGSTDRRHRMWLVALIMLTLAFLAGSIVASLLVYQAVRESAQDGQDLASQVQAECDNPRGDLVSTSTLCAKSQSVIDDAPNGIKGDPGPVGPAGPQGSTGKAGSPPSTTQIQNAVTLYCANHTCRGRRGQNATASQVASAVALYCDARGRCAGPRGSAGSAGQDGAQGTQGDTGPQGPGPSGEQVAAAVENYCSNHNECRGPQGAAGPTGVITTVSDCDAPDGQVIDQINANYDETAQTVFVTCTYKDDNAVINPAP